MLTTAPKNGKTVKLLRKEHLAYIENPNKGGGGTVDFLHLQANGADLSTPLPVALSYTPAVDAEVYLSTRRDMRDAICLPGKDGVAYALNLLLDTDYFWFVKCGAQVSDLACFHTDATAPRMLAVDGISNVRDFGGFVTENGEKVKQGLLYRCSEFNSHVTLTEKGYETLCALGIKTDLDLRGAEEETLRALPETVAYYNLPLSAYANIFCAEQMELYRRLYELLAKPALYPVFLHCWGGIDRTGCFLFILGAALGMKQDDLFLDYEMSSFSIWGDRSRESDSFLEFLGGLCVYGKTVQTAAVGFLHACGVSGETLAAIREIFLTK